MYFRRYPFTNTQSRPCRWTSSKKFTVVENRKLGKIILPFQIYQSYNNAEVPQKKKSLNQDSEDQDNLIKQRIITRGGAVVHIRCGPAFHMWSKMGATEMRWNHHESSSETSLIFLTILTNRNRELHSPHMAHTYGGHHKKQPNQYKEGKISENWIEKKWVDNS